MPLQATSGAASYDGFGGGVAAVPNYIEDVFSTYLYTGDGSSAQNINNGIDLSGKGGMVWVKSRSNATTNVIVDTSRFVSSSNIQCIFSDSTAAASASANEFGSFNSNGFSIPYNTTAGWTNFGTRTFASWTFREQPKFFDVVTYTGTGSARTVAHALGAVPGCIIVKRTDAAGYNWFVYHVSLGNSSGIVLNQTGGAGGYGTALWNSTDPTSTVFSLGTNSNVNASGGTYVAYLFAHDAGGFGLEGTDNVISCGTFTGNTTVTLGYEPQWILLKNSGGVEDWYIHDTMRGWPVSGDARVLFPNLSSAESGTAQIFPNATGFTTSIGGGTYIYIAIRRGPMKVPTLGTSVYQAVTRAGTGAVATISSLGFPTDFTLIKTRTASLGYDWNLYDRLRGVKQRLATNSTNSESTETNGLQNYALMNGYGIGASNEINSTSDNFVDYNFRRAPGFFDEVCYTGNNTARTINHNLGVVPEMMIFKNRTDASTGWITALTVGGLSWTSGNFLRLELTNGTLTNTAVLDTTPTATLFSIPSTNTLNYNASNYVAYLFATCAGVSKVGSYTGNGTTQTINCGFGAGGARFVLIKRTDAAGDWYTYDTARGMTVLTDPYLLLNSTAAETATLGSVTTVSTGFALNSTILAAINVSAGTYIFLAIA